MTRETIIDICGCAKQCYEDNRFDSIEIITKSGASFIGDYGDCLNYVECDDEFGPSDYFLVGNKDVLTYIDTASIERVNLYKRDN